MLGGLRSLLHGAGRAAAAAASKPSMLLSAAHLPPLQLAPTPNLLAARFMKVMSSVRKRCEHCRLVKRGKLLYVYCSVHPRHKARNGPKRRQRATNHNG